MGRLPAGFRSTTSVILVRLPGRGSKDQPPTSQVPRTAASVSGTLADYFGSVKTVMKMVPSVSYRKNVTLQIVLILTMW